MCTNYLWTSNVFTIHICPISFLLEGDSKSFVKSKGNPHPWLDHINGSITPVILFSTKICWKTLKHALNDYIRKCNNWTMNSDFLPYSHHTRLFVSLSTALVKWAPKKFITGERDEEVRWRRIWDHNLSMIWITRVTDGYSFPISPSSFSIKEEVIKRMHIQIVTKKVTLYKFHQISHDKWHDVASKIPKLLSLLIKK